MPKVESGSIAKKSLLSSSSEDEESDEEVIRAESTETTKKKRKRKVDTELTINESYAQNYNQFREKEVYVRLKAKYGEHRADLRMKNIAEGEEELSSSSDDDDDEVVAMDKGLDKDFFKTLACLKSKDPRIYDGQTDFFEKSRLNRDDDDTNKSAKSPKERPLTLGDLERKVMTEREGVFEEEEDEVLRNKTNTMSYYEEMDAIKADLRKAHDEDDEEEEDNSSLLRPKTKSESELKNEEDDYRAWLAGRQSDLKDESTKNELKPIKEFWNNEKLSDDEKFLRNYILNKGYLEHQDDEVNFDNEAEDDNELEVAEAFEQKYNYRFEDPDPEFIKRYPRTVSDSLRRTESKRSQKRAAVAERKREEKEQRREELKHLKALKRKEILEKIEKLKKVAGMKELELNSDDLDEDFDPEKHDQRMNAVFDQNYETNNVDDEKPGISDLEDSDLENELREEDWDRWQKEAGEDDQAQTEYNGRKKKEIMKKQDDVNDNVNESRKTASRHSILEATSGGGRRSKKRSRFAEILEQTRPTFDPELQKSFDAYLDQYYSLDYEDIIGDMPCRFKYRSVVANDFGLSTAEVLSAPDRELNAWCSLKKAVQYRSEEEERRDRNVFKSKANNVNLKQRVLPSLFKGDNGEEEGQTKRKGKKSKKERKRKKREALLNGDDTNNTNNNDNDEEGEPVKKKKKKKTNKDDHEEKVLGKDEKETEKKMKKSQSLKNTEETMKKKKKKKQVGEVKSEKRVEEGSVKKSSKSKALSNKKWGRKEREKLEKAKRERVNNELRLSDDRMKAYGLNPSQFKRKHKKKMFREKQEKMQDQ